MDCLWLGTPTTTTCSPASRDGSEQLFIARPDGSVAGDLFWYPVEGHPEIVVAPEVFIVFGRPKAPRRSYKQWEEGGIAPQVVFEIISDERITAHESMGVDPETV
jgi:Uma2 family endonuclease